MVDDKQIIVEIPKNAREIIRVTLGEYSGHQVAGARVWFQAEDGSWRPGKSGIAFRVALLPAVAEGLEKAIAEARRRGSLPPESVS
jgi:hypothetical protein